MSQSTHGGSDMAQNPAAGRQAPGHAAGHSAADGNMVDKLLRFDLEQEIAAADQKKPWPSNIYAKTLFKKPDLRVVLILAAPGGKMNQHHADGTISVQVLKGRIQFSAPGESHSLRAGNLLTLAASIKHEVEAQEDSAFLLTIGWPKSEDLQSMPHRGYGS